MVETPKEKPVDNSARNEAATLLAAALGQLNDLQRAAGSNSRLDGAVEQAKDAVSQIRNAMRTGSIDIMSLSAALNIGVDASALAVESERDGAAVAARVHLAAASLESRQTVERMTVDLFDKHEFDANVARHTHGADLEAFKRREAEDEKYIREQLARHSPDGDLNASGKMQGYMLDADVHGASDNPDFLNKWNELKEKTDRLRDSMRAAGKSTEEYDRHINEDVVAFLKARGLSDAQIKEALAKSENPLDAVKPYLSDDDASRVLKKEITIGDKVETVAPVEPRAAISPDQKDAFDVSQMNAKLEAAGLQASVIPEEATGHGLSIQRNAGKTAQGIGG